MSASLKDLAAEEAVIDLLAARVAEAKKDVRKRMQAALDAAAESDGVERVAASLPSGEVVATVSLRKGETGAAVVDEGAFARWVRETFPGEQWTSVRVVREVRPWKAAELLAEMTATGAPQIVHRETGEVLTVPGVAIRTTRARTHALTWRRDGKAAVAAAWHSGELAAQLAALTGPSEPEPA
ncbi:hypothetical protein ACFP1Z_09275 [Streptomyces gamaensis]|uniref:LigA protein n=1 Tax=Streptomyces gamaensis TaxID=1763542 RepID=A0ABW0YUU2_9ACTN